MNNNQKINSTSLAIGITLLLTLSTTFCLGAPLMLLGVHISAFHLIAGFIAAIIIVRYFSNTKLTIIASSATVIVFVLATLIASIAIDYSYDGMVYHQEAVYALAFDKWNPYFDFTTNIYDIWTIHYAKALEWVEACLVALVDRLECGKAINFVLAASTCFIVYSSIAEFYSNISRTKRALIVAIIVLNPIAVCQMLTYYIDYAFYYYLVLSIIFSTQIFRQRNLAINYIALSVTVVLAVGTKFNAFFMEGCTILAIIIGAWIYNPSLFYAEWRRYIGIVAITTLIGAFVICWHPYITNTISNGHPLYPLMGDNPADIMTDNTPEVFLGNNRFSNFFISIFSIKRPSVDQRIGGFGPLFGIILIISIIRLTYISVKQRRISLPTYVSIVSLITCFIFEQSWWARYNTQLWLIPIAALFSLCSRKSKSEHRLFTILSTLVICNIMICVTCTVLKSIEATSFRNAIYQEFNGKTLSAPNMQPQWKRHLHEHNINVKDISLKDVDKQYMLDFRGREFDTLNIAIEPMINLDEQQRARIDSIYEKSLVVKVLNKYMEYKKQ